MSPPSANDPARNGLPCDVLIVGSGAAGLTLALHLPGTVRVTVLSKGPLDAGSTRWAQGGISAALDATDSTEAHLQDTLEAGAGLCDPATVRFVVERGPALIRWLAEIGVAFTREGDEAGDPLHLTREGGHSHRRVVHAADATGRAVQTTLEALVRARPNVTVLEDHVALDLISTAKLGLSPHRVLGLYAFDRAQGRVRTLPASVVVLATGGASKVYRYTSNPDGATGDGIAMAWRAGCRIADLEFMQFHPTCLYHPKAKSFLLTEALRGEGARLLLPDGSPFMARFHPQAELAPRDIVARAIDHEMKRLGAEHLLLDITHKDPAFVRGHFPTVHEKCLAFGYDMTRQPLPVVPAAHYTCGGVLTDLSARTDLPGLYAVGEVACTGLHGANRMASNSLLECLVFGKAAAEDIEKRLRDAPGTLPVPGWDESRVTDSDEEVVVAHNWDELRHLMWDYVGIVRTTKRLRRAQDRVALLQREISEYYGNFRVTNDLIELRNLALCAELIIRCALARKESRGLHYTLDFPARDDARPARDTVLVPPNFAGAERGVHWSR
jgi:L-aspartate oxidase